MDKHLDERYLKRKKFIFSTASFFCLIFLLLSIVCTAADFAIEDLHETQRAGNFLSRMLADLSESSRPFNFIGRSITKISNFGNWLHLPKLSTKTLWTTDNMILMAVSVALVVFFSMLARTDQQLVYVRKLKKQNQEKKDAQLLK
jgi:predicted PurR-regulated permease PerM